MARDEQGGDGGGVSDRRLAEKFARVNLCGNQPMCRVHDDAAVLAPSSGEEPTPPRYRAGVASMA